jgi:hypothetical protein
MKHRTVKAMVIALLGLSAMAVGSPALAWHHHSGVRFGFFIGPPLFSPYWWYPPPPVYYDPPVIYQQPAVVAPPVVQSQPTYTPPPSNPAPSSDVIELGPAPSAGAVPSSPSVQPAPPRSGSDSAPQARSAQTGQTRQVYVYPRQGQSAQQQAADEATCNSWASTQMGSGFDANQAVSNFQRALAACLDAHGYSVR